jgi:hypothetical protein
MEVFLIRWQSLRCSNNLHLSYASGKFSIFTELVTEICPEQTEVDVHIHFLHLQEPK